MTEGRDQPALLTEGLGFDYGRERALDGVDLAVRPAELFAILGPNGGGKTTLFRILATLLAPLRGRASIFGHDVVRDPAGARRLLGVLFQAPAIDRLLTVRENLDLQGALYGLGGGGLKAARESLLSRFGLEAKADARAGTLSGGLQRRLEIAKSLLHRPRLLLLDEPSTGLDPGARAALWSALDELARASGTTVVFTTHLLEEADRAHRVAILDRGRIVALGAPESLKAEIGRQVLAIAPEPRALNDEDLRREIERIAGVAARLVEGRILVEAGDSASLVPILSRALGGRIAAMTVSRPTLFDVFLRRTGRGFEPDEGTVLRHDRGDAA
ncbi:MAG TPA: ABC transporter ATP-binding protein [Candidatus Polarisedimenticolia bacterium]|nr:ABC transporter ATP-binding protein [Candidatus Polarisedimenticolia bacterium]